MNIIWRQKVKKRTVEDIVKLMNNDINCVEDVIHKISVGKYRLSLTKKTIKTISKTGERVEVILNEHNIKNLQGAIDFDIETGYFYSCWRGYKDQKSAEGGDGRKIENWYVDFLSIYRKQYLKDLKGRIYDDKLYFKRYGDYIYDRYRTNIDYDKQYKEEGYIHDVKYGHGLFATKRLKDVLKCENLGAKYMIVELIDKERYIYFPDEENIVGTAYKVIETGKIENCPYSKYQDIIEKYKEQ